eukprot:TRINITY_DN52278_c0_g1_i1.p1 TRINITY_DN52278_c0_g1~~TRINITY_DN52278_c0_g1_i1.p1  ORF type:complete len:272 (+),score=32.18 TRINITY_DN52278_c0_g1_i1:108-923(+)
MTLPSSSLAVSAPAKVFYHHAASAGSGVGKPQVEVFNARDPRLATLLRHVSLVTDDDGDDSEALQALRRAVINDQNASLDNQTEITMTAHREARSPVRPRHRRSKHEEVCGKMSPIRQLDLNDSASGGCECTDTFARPPSPAMPMLTQTRLRTGPCSAGPPVLASENGGWGWTTLAGWARDALLNSSIHQPPAAIPRTEAAERTRCLQVSRESSESEECANNGDDTVVDETSAIDDSSVCIPCCTRRPTERFLFHAKDVEAEMISRPDVSR